MSHQTLFAQVPEGKVVDYIDGSYRNDTPEEYVRQNIERRLVLELGYSREDIEVEFVIDMGSARKRADIVIFNPGDPHNQEHIRTIIECKAEKINPSDSKNGKGQLKSYMAACPNAEWGMWSNGKQKQVYRKVTEGGKVAWEEPNDIPSADGSVEEVDRPTRETLTTSTGDNLLFSFKTCHDHIYVTDGLQKQPAFFELLKVIFCKITDERNIGEPLEFYATAKEKLSRDGQLTVKNRIGKIFRRVIHQYPQLFESNEEIKLQPRSLAYIVGELQRYSFLDTDIDVKGKAYEEIVGANLRGDRGEFFTPRNIQKMAVTMLDVQLGERVLDPSVGTGGFLVIAMNRMIDLLKAKAGGLTTDAQKQALNEKVKETAERCFFGIDINPDLVKATKMNMVMNNDGSGNIFRQDSLLHPHVWEHSFKKAFARALGLEPSDLRNASDLGHIDVIATNPPFGSKLPIVDRETLEQFDLAHEWVKDEGDGRWYKSDSLYASRPPEILFIERCYNFLRPGGRMAIVLPDGILGNPELFYVRYWILERFRLVASLDLHPDTFQPRNGTQTSILILQKKTQEERTREARQGQWTDYEIFMAELEACGHDKRGNTIFRRTDEGDEIWVDDDLPVELTTTADGHVFERPTPKRKVVDDDCDEIAAEFLAWKKQVVLGW